MVCGRAGCTKCLLLAGIAESVEQAGGEPVWTSTGGTNFAGAVDWGIVTEAPAEERHWVLERSKRWVCSWECFDRWAESEVRANGPATRWKGCLVLGGVVLSPDASERLRSPSKS